MGSPCFSDGEDRQQVDKNHRDIPKYVQNPPAQRARLGKQPLRPRKTAAKGKAVSSSRWYRSSLTFRQTKGRVHKSPTSTKPKRKIRAKTSVASKSQGKRAAAGTTGDKQLSKDGGNTIKEWTMEDTEVMSSEMEVDKAAEVRGFRVGGSQGPDLFRFLFEGFKEVTK